MVPSAAIQTGLNGSLFVWTVDNDSTGKQVARMQPVKVALAEGQSTILDSGPESGAKVVVDGADRLRPGQQVTVSAARQRASQQGSGSSPGKGAEQKSPFTGTNPAADAGNPGSQRQHQ